MTRQALIEKAIQTINHLPTEKIKEISSYAEIILKQQEEKYLSKNIKKIKNGQPNEENINLAFGIFIYNFSA